MNFKKYHVSKNLFDISRFASISGGAYSIDDTTITMKGNSDATFYYLTWQEYEAGTYTFTFERETPLNCYYVVVSDFSLSNCKLDGSDLIMNAAVAAKFNKSYAGFRAISKTSFTITSDVPFYFAIAPMQSSYTISNIMLNAGSQPLPYEPYGDTWTNIPHYIHNTSTDTITTLPADIYANDTTATVGLKGNMEQSGTPSTTNPIQPQECGELEENVAIIDNRSDTITNGYYKDIRLSDELPAGTYTISFTMNSKTGDAYSSSLGRGNTTAYQADVSNYSITSTPANISKTITLNSNACIWARFLRSATPATFSYNVSGIAIVSGDKPYGQYKIPILSGGTTTNVYMGEVQSTRQIKKLVLDGTENWNEGTSNYYIFINVSGRGEGIPNSTALSTHTESGVVVNNNGTALFFKKSVFVHSSLADFKTYLQQQYAAGTPVCVWYVLANPETAVVNEPLRKIGTYADEVSGITIPTIAGANTLSVGTTLQPSEVTVNYKGWHPVQSVHVYPDSSWMPTSWEEFRKAVRYGKAQSLYPVGTKLYENWGDTTSDAWIVVDYPTGEDYLDSDLAQQGYTNRVMLMEEKLNYLRQFDAIEAWLYVETAIPAGTYRFTIPNYDASYGGNKTYIFTSTVNVPVGGQLTLTWAYQQNPSAVQAYSSATSTSALFNVSITEWDGTTACTDLGTIKLAQNDADSTYGKLNHIHRARYGSNNYYQSGYRQWLNTNASANWWTPTNVFDRPYGNRTNAGRLNVMNSNMKSVLATPTVNCITNNLFEYPSLDGTTFSLQTAYTVTDKLFPVTHSEINLSSSPNVNSVLDYYVGKGNADRIKYRKDNGNAYYWWLRTPIPTGASGVRIVVTSGALSGISALSTYGSAAACIIQ